MKVSKVDIRDAFFEEIYNLGKRDKNVLFISDDLDAFVLRKFKKDFPEQFINIGVAEQNMIDVSAGLAASGKKVFCYGICSYVTLRCFEQIKFSVCSMNLPVTIIGVGAGFSFSFDGPTHHGVMDIGAMRILPEITIYNPCDNKTAAFSVQSSYKMNGPSYIRLDKGCFPNFYKNSRDFKNGFSILRGLRSVNVISTGYMTSRAFEVCEELVTRGIDVGLIDVFRLKPVSMELADILKKSSKLITIEENSEIGGLGTIVADIISQAKNKITLNKLAVADKQFSVFGSREWLLLQNGLDNRSLTKEISRYAKE
ncbi:MAG: hypothetical protein NUV69_04285 [Candidatus Curtissbacteria bacterium]|nr:hypothetical protein [Candidatus Curtissbacteria bacterium]